ncbi:MAG TPA: SRPBCC family protein [Candidatus Polarisedimenticolaceae bacterium]|nr:SRPBCC family protein [Candidatus Polarisedimenticolaceae bacterium]
MRLVRKLLLGLIGVVALLAGVGLLLPRQAHCERATTIDAPPVVVFTVVNGFKSFNRWSPWNELDPDAKYTWEGPDSGVGAKLSWVGDPSKVGSGSQAIVESQPLERVKTRLDFGPQGQATATFRLAPAGGGTQVTWAFDTDLGWNPVSRYFGLLLDRFVGKDFERGLANLKRHAESLPKVDFADLKVEAVDVEAQTVAFVAGTSSKDDPAIAAAIEAAYAQVGKFLSGRKLKPSGPPFTINTRWDQAGYGFDAAIPIAAVPQPPVGEESPVQVKRTYAGRALKVVHVGALRELPGLFDKLHAFTAAHAYEPAGPSWDVCLGDPRTTPEAQLVTHVFQPIRAEVD